MQSCLIQVGIGVSVLSLFSVTQEDAALPMTTGTLNISQTAQDQVTAPAGVWFEATDIAGLAVQENTGGGYDPSFHEITFVWTVRDTPLPVYTAPQNIVTGWNDANLAYGKKVAFTFPTAGQYTIDLWAIDANGATATAEKTITVVDTASVYPGALTLCYSHDPSEDWTEEVPGCQRVTSLSQAQNAMANASQPTRLLLKRGQSIDDFYISLGASNLGHLGAWGSGVTPIVRTGANAYTLRAFQSTPQTQVTVENIDFRGGWDSTTETGMASITPLFLRDKNTSCFYTLHRCNFSGYSSLTLTTAANVQNTVIVSDTVITNWRDYGIFIFTANHPDTRVAVIGSRIAQHPDALNGGTKNGLHNTHGPIRYANTSNVYLGVLDLFSRCGWSGLGTDTADQPCLRINHLGEPDRSLSIDRVVAEGGFRLVSMGGQNGGASGTVEHAGNYVLDKVLLIASAKTIGPFVQADFGGTTVRNMVGIMPNVLPYHINSWPGAITMVPDNPHVANNLAPMAIHNNTFLNLRSAANDSDHAWILENNQSPFVTLTMENNLLHAPDLDTPVLANGIDASTNLPGITPRYKGVRFNFEGQAGTFNSTIDVGQSFSIPYTEVTTALVNQASTGTTNQAYWLQVPDTDHLLITQDQHGNPSSFTAQNGDLTVSFEVANIVITNTSNEPWHSTYRMRLDRHSLLPPMQSQFETSHSLPLAKYTPPSNSTYNGARAYSDFMNTVRPGPGSQDHHLNVRISSGEKPGAIQAD